ncbi:MAG: hypothetical protein EOP53_12155, partial [Sphingobacteriales bacterium]
MHPHIQKLIHCINLEEKEQAERYKLDQANTLKALKAEGLALHPINVTRKNFGYADYPEISFRLPFPTETNMFRDGAAIECFKQGEEPVKGILLSLDGKTGEFRLFAPDFPDWMEEDNVGIKLAPDTRTTGIMKKVLIELEHDRSLYRLFEKLHGENISSPIDSPFLNTTIRPLPLQEAGALNDSQQQAVSAIDQNELITIVHGPPGTGKTTTLIKAIEQLIAKGEKIMVSAPSNAAVDNICKGLLSKGIKLFRAGNSGKVDEAVFPYTAEGKLANSKLQKDIRQLKLRAEEFRRMALKYKRSFGKAEREQRNLLFKEVKSIRTEIKQLQQYNEEKLLQEADVIAGTPIGLYDAGLNKIVFDQLIIDEAGQCIEPLAWCLFSFAPKIVLAGDHWQLPPTVLSNAAMQAGFNRSILEVAIEQSGNVHLLNTQYRMKPVIADFSSQYFYKGLLQSAAHLLNSGTHLTFIDTAGSGFNETHGPDGVSLQNEGELNIVKQLLQANEFIPEETAFISPYSGQVLMAKEQLPKAMRISTIDSFQGQEKQNIILSLVRSNDDGEIGFLKDYRRMNVAMT